MRPSTQVDPDTGYVSRSPVARRGRCGCPKLAYASRKLAKAAAKRHQRGTGELIHAYHCEAGHCWHVGHPVGSRSTEARSAWLG